MDGASRQVKSKLTGRFNVDNLLSIAAMLMVSGYSFEETCNALEQLRPVPGRMQDCGTNGPGARVIVDYAHSPDSLEAVLASLRELKPRRLIVLFGCGGGRDRSKRPLMGRVAERAADLVIITSDNPRDEDPADIAHEIVAGMDHAPFAVIEDRRTAIGTAIGLAESGDIVLVAGKGHETYQERRGQRFAFSDQHVIREALAGVVR